MPESEPENDNNMYHTDHPKSAGVAELAALPPDHRAATAPGPDLIRNGVHDDVPAAAVPNADGIDLDDLGGAPFEGGAVQTGGQFPTSDIDLDAIAVDQHFAAMAAVKPDSSAPPIRKPGNQIFFSPYDDQKLWLSFLTIKDEADSDTLFVLDRSLASELPGEYQTTLFVPCITKQQEVFFWPIKLPDSEGRIDSWNTSKLEHAVAGAGKWFRLRSNQFVGGYDKFSPSKQPAPPVWPDDVRGLLKKAVSKVYIANMDHPLIKRLLGEA